MPPPPGLFPPFMALMWGHALAAVQASPAQREQIRKILEEARADLASARQADRARRDEALALFAAPVVDVAAVQALQKQGAARQEQVLARQTQAWLAVAQVLTPAQRAQLVDALRQHQALPERQGPERPGAPPAPR